MGSAWLNLVLSLTNRIYSRKQELIRSTGIKGVQHVFVLVFLEIFLAFISIPLYLGLKSALIPVYLKEKGSYEKISFDYNLRKVLTLTGLGIFLLIWIIKLALIVYLPQAYGPLSLYRVGKLDPVDMAANSDLGATSLAFQSARTIGALPRPELKEVKKIAGGNFIFSGVGQPGMEAVLLLSEKNTVVYSAPIGKDGHWEIEHSQKEIKLGEGNHSVLVFNFDAKAGVRSSASEEKFFKITTTRADSLVKNIDTLTNWWVVIVILLGILLTFLTI